MDKPAKGFTRLKGQLSTKALLIEAAAARADDAALAEFVPLFFAHVSGRDLEGRSAEELHAAAAAHASAAHRPFGADALADEAVLDIPAFLRRNSAVPAE